MDKRTSAYFDSFYRSLYISKDRHIFIYLRPKWTTESDDITKYEIEKTILEGERSTIQMVVRYKPYQLVGQLGNTNH